MSDTVGSVIAADKATTEAATRGPWSWTTAYRVPELVGIGGNEDYTYETTVVNAAHSGECGCRSACTLELEVEPADAQFIAEARSRWPLYIAAIEAVQALAEDLADMGHNGHGIAEGEPECPGCVAADLRRALAVLAPNKEQQ
jgi:hypothetical protein